MGIGLLEIRMSVFCFFAKTFVQKTISVFGKRWACVEDGSCQCQCRESIGYARWVTTVQAVLMTVCVGVGFGDGICVVSQSVRRDG